MKQRRTLPTSFRGCLLALLASSSLAEQHAAPSEDYFFADLPIVLSASRLAQPVAESPAAMTVIGRELIEASGAITIPDVLRLVPGFQVAFRHGLNQTAHYHGLADQHPKRMQVLIDGRSVYNSAFGGVRWDTLPVTLDDVARIEVLRGSNAASYGSNAFMGVVNIVTRHTAQTRGNRATLIAGYRDTYGANLSTSDQVGSLNYRFSVGYDHTDGFPDADYTHVYWDSTGGPIAPRDVVSGTPWLSEKNTYRLQRENEQAISRMNFRGDYLMNNGDALLFELGLVRNRYDNSVYSGKIEDLNPDQAADSNSQLLKWTRTSHKLGEMSLQFSHNQLEMDTLFTDILIERSGVRNSGILLNFGPIESGYQLQNDRYDLEWQHTPNEFDGWRLVWGGGVRLDRIDGDNAIIGNQAIETWQHRLFANLEKHLGERDQWIVNAGLMLEEQQRLGTFASPRLAVNYRMDGYNTVRAALSRAYRMPSFAEQFGETRLYTPGRTFDYLNYSNNGRTVSAERLDTLEIGFVSSGWVPGLSFDVRLFHEELRDYIDELLLEQGCSGCDDAAVFGLDPHDLWVYDNVGWMDIQGVDLQARYDLDDRTFLTGAVSVVNSRGQRVSRLDSSGGVAATRLIDDYVPSVTLSGLLAHRFSHGWSGSLAYYRMETMHWPDDGQPVSGYQRFDLRLAKNFKLEGNDTTVELLVQNALGKDYAEFREVNPFERRVFLRMKLDFD